MALSLRSSAIKIILPSLRRPTVLAKCRLLSYGQRSWRTSGTAGFGTRKGWKTNAESTYFSRSLFITSVGIPFFNKGSECSTGLMFTMNNLRAENGLRLNEFLGRMTLGCYRESSRVGPRPHTPTYPLASVPTLVKCADEDCIQIDRIMMEQEAKKPRLDDSSTSTSPKGWEMSKTSKKPPGLPSLPALSSSVPIEISQIMLPDDTNPMGNVHGGTILKLIEKAGFIVSCRHCNKISDSKEKGQSTINEDPLTTILVRLEHMDFRQPMYVGEVAQLQAAVTYTSPKSIEVTVDVWAENVITNERRHTNTATLWYVAIPANDKNIPKGTKVMNASDLRQLIQPVPQLQELSEQELKEGKERYEAQKSSRAAKKENGSQAIAVCHSPHGAEDHTVLASQTTLANIVLPSDCTVTGHLTGGSLMKTMDSAAGICAARHCHSRVVTAGIDEINFYEPITNGEMVFVTARIIYTSTKSIEIEVSVEAENLLGGCRRVTNTAYFTFVSLGSDYRTKPVPQLKMVSDEERSRFEEGKKRYEARKKARMEKLQKLQEK